MASKPNHKGDQGYIMDDIGPTFGAATEGDSELELASNQTRTMSQNQATTSNKKSFKTYRNAVRNNLS